MIFDRSTVYVEGDAIMSTYNDAEGKTRSSLSIYQSKTSSLPCIPSDHYPNQFELENLEVLRRPTPTSE